MQIQVQDKRRKVGVVLTFLVGLFVTACSMVRLKYSSGVSKITNATYDYTDISLWSGIECEVGVICACMVSSTRKIPAERLVSFSGTTAKCNRSPHASAQSSCSSKKTSAPSSAPSPTANPAAPATQLPSPRASEATPTASRDCTAQPAKTSTSWTTAVARGETFQSTAGLRGLRCITRRTSRRVGMMCGLCTRGTETMGRISGMFDGFFL